MADQTNKKGLFDFFNKKKCYCERLSHHIHFRENTVEPCCCEKIGPTLVADLDSQNYICETFNKEKSTYIKQFKQGKIPKTCTNCSHISKYQGETDYKINTIILNHFTKCNCACVYCTQNNNDINSIVEAKQTKPQYDIIKFIQELYDKQQIDTANLMVDFQGGDIAVLKNADELIDLFLTNGVKNIQFLTNNIVYQPLIEKTLKLDKGYVCTSLDAGTAETFKKIKQVDKFDNFINNLKKYIAAVGSENIHVKYIVVKDINDSLDEFSTFYELMRELGIQKIVFDIDYRNIISNEEEFVIPQHYYEIYKYYFDNCTKNNLDVMINNYTKSILDKGYSDSYKYFVKRNNP